MLLQPMSPLPLDYKLPVWDLRPPCSRGICGRNSDHCRPTLHPRSWGRLRCRPSPRNWNATSKGEVLLPLARHLRLPVRNRCGYQRARLDPQPLGVVLAPQPRDGRGTTFAGQCSASAAANIDQRAAGEARMAFGQRARDVSPDDHHPAAAALPLPTVGWCMASWRQPTRKCKKSQHGEGLLQLRRRHRSKKTHRGPTYTFYRKHARSSQKPQAQNKVLSGKPTVLQAIL